MAKAKQMTVEEFVYQAIEKLRTGNYKGIHSVYSGFNEGFKKYFPELDPVAETSRLQQEGKLVIKPTRGGVILYKAGETPASADSGDDAVVEGESKSEKFKRIALLRKEKILDTLKLLGNCANPNYYVYSKEDINKIFVEIDRELQKVKAKFDNPTGEDF